MFGVSFQELVILGAIALLVLGPHKLPSMLRTLGQWVGKLRRLTTEVRQQSGIDDALRAEGLDGGLNELRSIMRGGFPVPGGSPAVARGSSHVARSSAPSRDPFTPDRSREYPLEGPDCFGALPEDLLPEAQDARSQRQKEREQEQRDEAARSNEPTPPEDAAISPAAPAPETASTVPNAPPRPRSSRPPAAGPKDEKSP